MVEPQDIAAVLDNPAASSALKAVLRAWLPRDCVDAACDTILCDVLEARTDRTLGRLS